MNNENEIFCDIQFEIEFQHDFVTSGFFYYTFDVRENLKTCGIWNVNNIFHA